MCRSPFSWHTTCYFSSGRQATKQEATMRWTIAMCAMLLATFGAYGQLHGSSGPFTNEEAQLMSAVWPKIREAATFEDIDW